MKLYELSYLIPSDISEQDLKALEEKIISLIQQEEGRIIETEKPIKKRLGHHIKNKEMAYLITLNFYFNPEKLKVLEKELKALKTILRYLILTKKAAKAIKVPRRIKPKPELLTKVEKPKKVELKKIEQKLKELLGE